MPGHARLPLKGAAIALPWPLVPRPNTANVTLNVTLGGRMPKRRVEEAGGKALARQEQVELP